MASASQKTQGRYFVDCYSEEPVRLEVWIVELDG